MSNPQLKNKLLYLILIAIVLFVIVPPGNAASFNPDDYEYSDDGSYIYEYNKKTKEKKKILDGWGMKISHKKDRIAYIFYRNNPASSSKQYGFYMYNLKTNDDKVLLPLDGEGDPIELQGWSPNDKYLIFGNYNYTIGTEIIFDSVIGNEVANFANHEGEYDWIDVDKIVFTDIQQRVHQESTFAGAPYGIATIDLATKQIKVLKQATSIENYHFIKYEPNKILFSSTSIAPGGIWGEAQESKTYWLMDNNGNILEEVKDYKP